MLLKVTSITQQEKELKNWKRENCCNSENIWLYIQKRKRKYKLFKFKIEFTSLWAEIQYTKVSTFYMASITENKNFKHSVVSRTKMLWIQEYAKIKNV